MPLWHRPVSNRRPKPFGLALPIPSMRSKPYRAVDRRRCSLEPLARFELASCRLEDGCSSFELQRLGCRRGNRTRFDAALQAAARPTSPPALVAPRGIEPRTFRFRAGRSTAELRGRNGQRGWIRTSGLLLPREAIRPGFPTRCWRSRPDSNRHPPPSQSGAHPVELREPVTGAASGLRSHVSSLRGWRPCPTRRVNDPRVG